MADALSLRHCCCKGGRSAHERASYRLAEPMNTIVVDGEILLRRPALEDAESLFALVGSNRQHLRRWLPWVDFVTSLEDERFWVQTHLPEDAPEFVLLMVYQGDIVGAVGIRGRGSRSRRGEIGYWIAENMQGRGIVTRSCRVLIDYMFEQLNLNRVVIRVSVDNVRSRGIPHRLGFTLEGIERQSELLYDDTFQDMSVYSMLASEWPAKKATL